MDISLRLNDPDVAQAPRLQPSPMREDVAGTPSQATQGTQVNISAEARAAEEAARQQPAAAPQAVPPAQADSAVQVQASAPVARADGVAAALATPLTQTETTNAARAAGVPLPSAPDGGSPRADSPDAASSASNQAVQMYLDNAVRPETQPLPTAVRASA